MSNSPKKSKLTPEKGGLTSDDLEAQIVVHVWKEPEFKKKLLTNPREALEEMGVQIPKEIQCKVLEENSRTWTLVIPTCPKNIGSLNEEELLSLAKDEIHPLQRARHKPAENLWDLFSHRFWPTHHEE